MYGEDRRHAQYTITAWLALGTFCTLFCHLCFSVLLSCSCCALAVALPHVFNNAWIAALRASFKPICACNTKRKEEQSISKRRAHAAISSLPRREIKSLAVTSRQKQNAGPDNILISRIPGFTSDEHRRAAPH